MMMSPGAYYETELKGKTVEQVMSAIRSLKRSIGALKNSLEAPDADEYERSVLDEKTQIAFFREYLECAKQEYARLGGEYRPSKAEQVAIEFDRRICEISRVSLLIGGLFAGTEIMEANIADGRVTVRSSLHLSGTDFKDDLSAPERQIPREEFLVRLVGLHLGEWRSNYSTSRFGYREIDGTRWELTVQYAGNPRDRVTFHGDNSFPYNFDELLCLLRGTEDEEDDEAVEILLTGEQEMLLDRLADYVATLPNGTAITTTQAMSQLFPDFDFKTESYAGIDLFDIHVVLFEKLEGRGIYPDMSAHEGQVEGMPYNLGFIVRHSKD